jgi:DNA-binding MarR family transcriptional regulator
MVPDVGERQSPLTVELVSELLYRRDVALSRHRRALARSLGLNDVEMAAVTHILHRGEPTTSQIGALVPLSSAGATALAQRLEGRDIVHRRRHPKDGRSRLTRLTPRAKRRVAVADAPFREGLAESIDALSEEERTVVAAFLSRLVELTEQLVPPPEEPEHQQYQPVPGLWG